MARTWKGWPVSLSFTPALRSSPARRSTSKVPNRTNPGEVTAPSTEVRLKCRQSSTEQYLNNRAWIRECLANLADQPGNQQHSVVAALVYHLPSHNPPLFPCTWVVSAVDVVDFERRLIVNLDHGLAIRHSIVMHLGIEISKATCRESHHLGGIEVVSHANLQLTREYR